MKKFLTIVFTLLVASNVWAFDFEIDGIYYNVIDGGVEVTYQTTDYNSYSGSVTIPETVTNDETTYSVISIGKSAFRNCKELTEISIPNCVTTINDYAFYGCSGLPAITLPDGIKAITYCLFEGCSGLTAFTIPNSVTSIDTWAFSGCRGLSSITIPSGIKSIKGGSFSSCSGLTSIQVESENTMYDSRNNCNAIIETSTGKLIAGCVNTIIPDGITSIEPYAFSNCSFTSITIPNSVTSIGNRAFSGCKNLTSITIPASVTFLMCPLGNCSALTSIQVEAGNTVYDSRNNCNAIIETATGTLIAGCVNTVIPENITSIYESAFQGCSGLTSITIPRTVTNISRYGVLADCNALTSIQVEAENTVLDSRNNCNAIIETATNKLIAGCNNTIIPNDVTIINDYAFLYCRKLSSITIPNNVSSINNNAFFGCSNLEHIICMCTTPPEINGSPFSTDTYTSACLYVPREAMDAYKTDAVWGKFETIKCIESEEVSLENDDVVVVPDKYEAVFSMPFSESADFYTLIIQNKGVTFCTITFNAQGHLTNINYSLNKSYELKEAVAGFQFTVMGLSEGTDYTYQFVAEKSDDTLYKEYTGSFRTTGTATAVVNVEQTNNITIVNNQILVNGEAPAFVVTVSGQKIANANLKAGVYFVVADGEMVGVSVR